MRKYVKAGWKVKVATQHSNEIKKVCKVASCQATATATATEGTTKRKLDHRID